MHRVDELIILVVLNRLHKSLGDANGEVEVCDVCIVPFAVNKFQDIRVVDAQNPHIGPSSGAALLDGFCSHVKHAQKADRAARHPTGGIDRAPVRAKAGEGKAGSAARFVDERGLLDRFKNGLHAVLDGEHKAGRELAEGPPRVHQSGGVWKKIESRHHLVKGFFKRSNVTALIIEQIRCGSGVRHSLKELLRGFDYITLFIFF